MKSLFFLSTAVLFLLNLVNANEDPFGHVHTIKFGPHTYHEVPTMNTKAKAGLGTGFAVFGVLFIFALVRVFIEEVERHKDINQKLIEARNRMTELELDLNEVDTAYEEYERNKNKPEDDDAKLIEKAAQRKREREAQKQQVEDGVKTIGDNHDSEHGERL